MNESGYERITKEITVIPVVAPTNGKQSGSKEWEGISIQIETYICSFCFFRAICSCKELQVDSLFVNDSKI